MQVFLIDCNIYHYILAKYTHKYQLYQILNSTRMSQMATPPNSVIIMRVMMTMATEHIYMEQSIF